VKGVNYRGTFIAVAPDSRGESGEVPPMRAGKPTVARLQYDMVAGNPYRYTSEEVLFRSSPEGRALDGNESNEERRRRRAAYFERPRACLRASPLPKQFGWGLHFDSDARVAVYGVESEEYRRLRADPTLRQLEAMRSRRT
jgi:hypothetical protein